MSEMHPSVSVVMPMFNIEPYIGHAISTVLAQTSTDFELICIDDGSTDGTADAVRKIMEKDTRIRLFSQTNQGAGSARNAGLEYASGEYLMFLDGDDWYKQDMLEKLLAAAGEHSADIVTCKHTRVFEGTNATRYPEFADVMTKTDNPFSFKDNPKMSFVRLSPGPWVYFYKKSFIDGLGIRFQTLPRNNDFFFTMSALAAADRIVRVDERLVTHLLRKKGNLQSGNDSTPLCIIQAGKAWREQLRKWNLFPLYEKRIYEMILCEATVILNKFRDFSAYKQLFDATKSFLAEYVGDTTDFTTASHMAGLFLQAQTAEDYLLAVKNSISADSEAIRNERDAVQLECERNAEKLDATLHSKSYRLGYALLHPFRKR